MKFSRALVPAIACIGLVMAAPARAQEDDDGASERTFEQNIIHQLLTGLGASNGRNGIVYRERSPLVLPPQLTLPPPQTNRDAALAPNWPKDPDELERKALANAKRESHDEWRKPLMPNELAKGRTAAKRQTAASPQPGQDPGRALLPNELGYRGGLFGSILTPQKEETAVFKSEPERTTLTDPPSGYQTPSPNFAYGVGTTHKKNQPLNNQSSNAPLLPGRY